jgi:nicotinamide mononucleotide transporter
MSFIEAVAVILGLVSVFLVTRQNVWCYPLGIISVFIYIFIFFDVKLYADMGLQVFFIILQVYGWYEWLHGGEKNSELQVTWGTRTMYMVTAVFVVLSTAVIGSILHRYTDASLPYIDSLLTMLSMAAQWMMAKKYIENWIVWTAVNIGSIAMYGMKGLYFTMFLYAVYLVLGIVGFFEWRKSFRPHSA